MELIALRLRARLWVNRPTIARDIASALQFLKTQRNVRGIVERQAADRRFDAIADGSNFLSAAAIRWSVSIARWRSTQLSKLKCKKHDGRPKALRRREMKQNFFAPRFQTPRISTTFRLHAALRTIFLARTCTSSRPDFYRSHIPFCAKT